MTVRFRARGSDGKVAIYTGTDDDPFDAPLDNLSRVLFHSDLLYPAIVIEASGTLSLSSLGANLEGRAAHTLFAHGLAGTPMVIGYVTLGGQNVPLGGSVPCQMDAEGWARWLSLGADATNVMIAETWFTDFGFSAIDVDWVAYVTDTLF